MMKRIITAAVFIGIFWMTAAIYAQTAPEPAADAEPLSSNMEEDVTKARLILGNERWMQMHFFFQAGAHSSKTWDEANGERKRDAAYSKDMYIGACRMILNGQLSEKVFFFMSTDDLTAGKSSTTSDTVNDSTGSNKLFTQDAYIKFMPARAFQIYTGLLTIPMMRQNMQSQATLLGPVPMAEGKLFDGYSNNGRDTGLMLRGLIPYYSNHVIEYRLAAFRGFGRRVENGQVVRNGDSMPRFSGRIQIEGADPEDGYFVSENYLGKRSIFCAGIGFDFQEKVRDNRKDYLAIGGDVSLDTPMDMQGRYVGSLQIGAAGASNYPNDANMNFNSYFMIYTQVGLLMDETIQPIARYVFRHEKGNGGNLYKTLSGGLNYFINGHYTNVKLLIDYPLDPNNNPDNQPRATLQVQAYF
jgi:hypothetical protein